MHYVSYVLTCLTGMHAFPLLLFPCFPFFTCLTCLPFLRALHTLIFSTCPMCLHFLDALRDFGFHVTYVPSFFTYFSYPHLLRALRALIFVRALLSFILLRVFSAVIFLRASRAFIILCVLCLHFLMRLHFIYGSRTVAPEENCPPTPKTNPKLNRGQFSWGQAIVRIPLFMYMPIKLTQVNENLSTFIKYLHFC